MFDFLFPWRKASSYKRLIQRIECRLKLLNSKRHAIVRQVRDDVALLLKDGHRDQTIFTRVEQLYMDEIIITVYELLGHFCQFISLNLPCIRQHVKQCPSDVNEAISSLLYASVRCGDVPELRDFRELIQERYGRRYVRTALELLPGNFVNNQIKEKLAITSVSDDAKFRMVNEIFRDYCLQSPSLAIQYSQEWHQKQVTYAMIPEKLIKFVNEEQRDVAEFASASKSVSEDCFSIPLTDLPNNFKNKQPVILPAHNSLMTRISRISSSSSLSDISVHLTDDNLVYLDDVDELKSPKLYDFSSPDTRVFLFKSSPLVTAQSGQNELLTRTRGKLRRTKSRKVRKMPSSRESVNVGQNVELNDVAYSKNCDSPMVLRQEKHSKKAIENETEIDPFSGKRGNFQCPVINDASLCDHPAIQRIKYFEHHDQHEYQPAPIAKQAMEVNKQSGIMKKRVMCDDNLCSTTTSSKSSSGSNSVVSAPTNKNIALTCYVKDAETRCLRAFTLPAPQRPRDKGLDMYSRTCSLPVPPNHVHPKLPDYDQIEAKFSAMKQIHQHNQCN